MLKATRIDDNIGQWANQQEILRDVAMSQGNVLGFFFENPLGAFQTDCMIQHDTECINATA